MISLSQTFLDQLIAQFTNNTKFQSIFIHLTILLTIAEDPSFVLFTEEQSGTL